MRQARNYRGFTLIELMIAVAVIGILASIAYPSYTEFIFRSNRTEAQTELMRLANLQEQRFVDWRAYTQDMTQLGGNGDPHITESGNYSVDAAISPNGDTFILTATAQGSQLRDADCPTLTITETGLQGPAATAVTCWER